MTQMTSLELVHHTKTTVGGLGARYMLHPETAAVGTAAGYENGWAWYFTGRGGVLGDVDAAVVASAFGFFGEPMVRMMWEAGRKVEGARAAGSRYAAACAEYGRKRLEGAAGLERFNELAERVISSVDGSGLSLFVALRAEPAPADAPGRAYWNLCLLREWRGSEHVVAVRASGLTPAQAILTGYADAATGIKEASRRGFGDGHPDASGLAGARQAAEDLTDRLQATGYEVLTGAERAELASLVDAVRDALDADA
ncbi:MAG: SCO6745 family protein [Ilumatobacteraceae bacterium]